MSPEDELKMREARMREHMEKDFLPHVAVGGAMAPVDQRIANALEYIAHHVGGIHKRLDAIQTLLDERNAKGM